MRNFVCRPFSYTGEETLDTGFFGYTYADDETFVTPADAEPTPEAELTPTMVFDLGKIDDRGYLQIVGRGKDLIISGGYNIYPKEIELVLDDQPGVLESAVIGAPHGDFGEGVVAVLVPEAGAVPDMKAIKAAMADSLARFKQPKHFALMDSLPRNTMGKVQKNLLRGQFADVFTSADA